MFDSGKLGLLFSNPDKESPVYIISEIGINHNGSLKTAIDLIHASKEAGVDAVKFQKRDLAAIYSSLVLSDANSSEWSFEYLIPLLKEVELSAEDYAAIREECDLLELDLIITPFDTNSADFVAKLGISAFKIASADMTNIPLVRLCNSYGLPILISVGMWDETDINSCVEIYKTEQFNYALLLAQSTYPASYETLNLGYIAQLKKLATVVGYSGHERGTFIPVAAVALGCRIIEKHITFDKNQKGPDHKASMLPREWEEMVHQLRMVESSLGEKKLVNQAEKLCKEAFAKSAVPVRDLPANHLLCANDVIFRSPGKGIFPHEFDRYLGKVLKRSVKKDHYINKTDFEEITSITNWKTFSFSKCWGVKCRFHDYTDFEDLNTPCIEFHCSQTDLNTDFNAGISKSLLIVHAPEIFDRQLVDICSDDKGIVEGSLQILQRSVEKTLAISKFFPKHKPRLVVHLGGMSLEIRDLVDTKKLTERAIDNFSKLDYSPDDIDILPENLPPRPWYLGGEWFQHGFMHSRDMIDFCSHFGLGMVYDVCHASLYCHKFNDDLVGYTKNVMPIVRHLHISDAYGTHGEGVQIGEGEIDFDSLFSAIRPYQFSWVSEIWSGHLHQATGLYESLKRLEKYHGAL